MSKSLMSTIILILCVISASAQEITAEKISDNILVVMGGGGNITAVNTDEGLLVIDCFMTPASAKQARELIEKSYPGKPVRYLINTHYHSDHTFGNQVFSDALIIAHANTTDRMKTAYAERAASYASAGEEIKKLEAEIGKLSETDSAKAGEIRKELERWKRVEANYSDFVLTPPSFNLEDGAVLSLGDKTIRLMYFGPGHTSGDLVILVEEEKLLVLGDLLFHHSVPYIDVSAGADVTKWIKILDGLIEMSDKFETVVPGHGEVGTVQALIDKRTFIDDLWTAVSNAYKQGMSLEEAKEKIKLEKYKDYSRIGALGSNIEACWTFLAKENK